MTMMLGLIGVMLLLAYANGANDNFKGVQLCSAVVQPTIATPYGGQQGRPCWAPVQRRCSPADW